jgi:hypothetical protein
LERELMYGVDAMLIAGALLVAMLLVIEAGYRFGRAHEREEPPMAKAHVNAIQASLLGILALLLGFTFSSALQRFDARSEAAIAEANTLSTAWQRADLLPGPHRARARAALREYLDIRIVADDLTMDNYKGVTALRVDTTRSQARLWEIARQAVLDDPDPVRTGLYAEAVNALVDAYVLRNAALDRRVPEVVLFLLMGTFLMAGVVVGFATGVAGHRPSLASHVMVALIAVLVFIILDLDRPRRGLVQVDHRSLLELRAEFSRQADASRPQ